MESELFVKCIKKTVHEEYQSSYYEFVHEEPELS